MPLCGKGKKKPSATQRGNSENEVQLNETSFGTVASTNVSQHTEATSDVAESPVESPATTGIDELERTAVLDDLKAWQYARRKLLVNITKISSRINYDDVEIME